MKYALIDPNTIVADGFNVAQVEQVPFEVATPLYWVTCSDNITAEQYYYQPALRTFALMPNAK